MLVHRLHEKGVEILQKRVGAGAQVIHILSVEGDWCGSGLK